MLVTDVEVAGHDEHLGGRAGAAQLVGDREAGHPRHVVVDDDQVEALRRRVGEDLGAVPGRGHEVTGALEHVADEVADVGLVVRDEAAQGHGIECGPRRVLLSRRGAILGRM